MTEVTEHVAGWYRWGGESHFIEWETFENDYDAGYRYQTGFYTACNKGSLTPRYGPLVDRPTGRLCEHCQRLHPVPGRPVRSPKPTDAKPQPVRSANAKPVAGHPPDLPAGRRVSHERAAAVVSIGSVVAVFMVVFGVTLPIAWFGLGLVATAAYWSSWMGDLFLGPLGLLWHIGATVLLALLVAVAAAGAVRGATRRSH